MREQRVCGLFAGIGGLELGLQAAGYHPSLFCEIDEDARAVLDTHFPDVRVHSDIRDLDKLPSCDIVTAGFPCQDLSMAGNKVGIAGTRSGLVTKLIQLLQRATGGPTWVIIENVPYMLSLDRGRAMSYLTSELERLGMRWAYRVVDARGFGLPQRRSRVVLVASWKHFPELYLFRGDAKHHFEDPTSVDNPKLAYGFYWTEGKRGLGWTIDAVPTIKGGSSLGIASPPAIWDRPARVIGTPDIRDLERMQGFPADWTEPARPKSRWRLIGNAVSVPVADWVGRCLRGPAGDEPQAIDRMPDERWPSAAFGGPGTGARLVTVSSVPERHPAIHLRDFLNYPLRPLSERATRGYLNRVGQATALNFPPHFVEALQDHLKSFAQAQRRLAPAS